MSEDHLSGETSISAEVTETGMKAAAKSRAVSSMDRLLGGAIDVGSAWLEGVAQRRRAKNEGERQLIEATVKYGLDKMNVDDDFAQRAFEGHFKKVGRQQLNKDAVVAEALEDLRQNPPSSEEEQSGPDLLDEDFVDRFERYAEGATSDQLRQRWGRILAGEIRKPGTFSPKVLRATDELDATAAALFESLMPFRVRDHLVLCMMQKLSFDDQLTLVSAGLVVEPGFSGHIITFGQGVFNGKDVWATEFGQSILTIPKDTSLSTSDSSVLAEDEGIACYSVVVLTDVGTALASILPSNEFGLGQAYAEKLKSICPQTEVLMWGPIGQRYVPIYSATGMAG